MLTATDLKEMAEKLAREGGRFSPGTDAFRTLWRAAEAVRLAEIDVRMTESAKGDPRAA